MLLIWGIRKRAVTVGETPSSGTYTAGDDGVKPTYRVQA